jgi:hypothetical protein
MGLEIKRALYLHSRPVRVGHAFVRFALGNKLDDA